MNLTPKKKVPKKKAPQMKSEGLRWVLAYEHASKWELESRPGYITELKAKRVLADLKKRFLGEGLTIHKIGGKR